MDEALLEQKWDEMAAATFNQFIKEFVGTKNGNGLPECFGSGNNKKWCTYCSYKPSCVEDD